MHETEEYVIRRVLKVLNAAGKKKTAAFKCAKYYMLRAIIKPQHLIGLYVAVQGKIAAFDHLIGLFAAGYEETSAFDWVFFF